MRRERPHASGRGALVEDAVIARSHGAGRDELAKLTASERTWIGDLEDGRIVAYGCLTSLIERQFGPYMSTAVQLQHDYREVIDG